MRRLELREGAETRQDAIDEVFGTIFDKVVVEIDAADLDFEQLVEFFEDVEEAHGGELKDEEHLSRLTYTAPDSTRIRIEIEGGRISLSGGGRQDCSTLLARARKYRFGLTGPSRLLLT